MLPKICIGLTLGGKWIVDGAVQIALQFGMSQTLVGLTVVVIGTSLPELATSAVAARKRNVDIAVGNVVGSNIFNIFLVLGNTALIRPLPFHTKNTIDLGVMMGANILLFASMFLGKKHIVDRWEGGLFLIVYAAYLAISIIRNV
jgi:cation:H+ antiporter